MSAFFNDNGVFMSILELTDDDFVYVMPNEEVAAFFGVSVQEVTGKSARELGLETSLITMWVALFRKAVESGETVRHEYPVTQKGTTRWFLGKLKPLQVPAHHKPRASFVVTEITQSKVAEDTLHTKEELFKALSEHTLDITTIAEADGTIRYESPSIQQIMGYHPSELEGKHFTDWVHPDDVSRVLIGFKDAIDHPGSVRTIEFRFKHKDESYRHLESVGTNLLDNPVVHGLIINSRDITKRKRAEELLHQTKEKYRAIFENAQEGIYQSSPEGKLLTVNPVGARMLGFSSPEDMITSITDLAKQLYVNERDRIKFAEKLKQDGHLNGFETQFRRRDGSVIWVSLSGRVVTNETGGRHFEGIAQDITERKEAVERLRQSEERLRLLSENVSDLITMIDGMGVCSYASASYRNFGYDPEEITGKHFLDYVHPDDLSIVQEQLRLTSEKYVNRSISFRIRKRDGSFCPVETTFNLLINDGGVRVVAVSRDITSRLRWEVEVRKLSQAVTQSPASVVITDLNGNIEYVNARFTAATGYLPEEVVGKNPRILKSGETPSQAYTALSKTISSGKEWRGELHNRKKNGELFWEQVAISPIIDEKGQIIRYLAIKEDITENKKAEEELRWRTALFQAQLDSSPDGILVVNNEGKKIIQNQRLIEVFNISESIANDDDDSKLLQHVVCQTKHPEHFDKRVAYLYAHPEEVGQDEVELVNGRVLDRYSAPVQDKAGRYYGRIWAFRDITERKLSEKALAAERHLLRTVIDNIPDRIYVKDTASRFIINNVAHLKALGVTAFEQVIGKTDRDFRPADLAQQYQADDKRVVEMGVASPKPGRANDSQRWQQRMAPLNEGSVQRRGWKCDRHCWNQPRYYRTQSCRACATGCEGVS